MILAFDTSQQFGSIALGNQGKAIYAAHFDLSITHSETLMPQIDHALALCGIAKSELMAIAITLGPGSFTGLRIGLATAKGMAMGLNIPILAYSTLSTVAKPYLGLGKPLTCILDAKMKQFYAAIYDGSGVQTLCDGVYELEEIIAKMPDHGFVLGSAAEAILKAKTLGSDAYHVPDPLLYQMSSLALLAMAAECELPEYDFEYVAELEPRYLRESTAQIKKKQGGE